LDPVSTNEEEKPDAAENSNIEDVAANLTAMATEIPPE
jgi:hypothetical protein